MKSRASFFLVIGLPMWVVLWGKPETVSAQIYVVNTASGTIGEYTTAGATVNASLISGLDSPIGLAVSGGYIYVSSPTNFRVGEYTTAGATVNATLISEGVPSGLAVSGGNIFVSDDNAMRISEYTSAGAVVNASLISGLMYPEGLAVSGGNIFVANRLSGTIGEYTTAGATVNASLISGLSDATYLDVEPVPEPATFGLLCLPLAVTLAARLRRKA